MPSVPRPLLRAQKQADCPLPAQYTGMAHHFESMGHTPSGGQTEQTSHPKKGKVYLIGAGPGDPELMTLKAVRLLSSAEAVVYDHLVSPAIVDMIPPGARKVYAGKEARNHALPQGEINRTLIELARQGLQVARLKGGDPFIFGRGGEEMQALEAAGIECVVVPGITAASGAASCTGIPLTHREHSHMLVFATGHLKDGTVDLDWPALVRPHQTVVIYMGLGMLEIICRELIAHGLPAATPAAVIHAATTSAERSITSPLTDLPAAVRKAGINPPALIMIGNVVGMRHQAMPYPYDARHLAT